MESQQLAGRPVDDGLEPAPGVSHRLGPAHRGVHPAHRNIVPRGACLVLGQADRGEHGVAEDGPRHDPVVDHLARVLDEVERRDGPVVGRDVGEHVAALDVTDGCDVGLRGSELAVDPHEAVFVGVHACGRQPESVDVRDTAGRHEDRVGNERGHPVAHPSNHLDAGTHLGRHRGGGPQPHVHTLLPQMRRQQVGQLGIFAGRQVGVAAQQRDPRAHAREHLGELDPDVAGSDDDEASG